MTGPQTAAKTVSAICTDCGFAGFILCADGRMRCAKDFDRWKGKP